MNNFLLDIWHDLRAKRLWPVALVLLSESFRAAVAQLVEAGGLQCIDRPMRDESLGCRFAVTIPPGPVSQPYTPHSCGRPDHNLRVAMLADHGEGLEIGQRTKRFARREA